ncbi:hypothetical protein [Aureliella helgolandensis]|uniref:Uncharacterized protein n=1 Tax=Aureliella helgolandensis TaxID=2527968 RepID=A0A518G8I6_9BACT|nr:hypothetical protein [Aureliella helgolandensis]QDV24899.1 hypothetical protein Q31a_32210 [Aureliella helgolandensis]
MNTVPTDRSNTSSPTAVERLVVPQSLQAQLSEFRRRVWRSKLGEAIVLGLVAVLLAFLTVYTCDRLLDTPRSARTAIFLIALAAWIAVPWALHRWIWKHRSLEQLARLLRVREPAVGDQLLSVIELAEDDSEQARSRTLCAAAITQVAETAKTRNFREAAPPTRLRGLSTVFVLATCATIVLGLLFPAAVGNAWARLATPWRDTPRYTFTEIETLPPNRVVAHGESSELDVVLKTDSRWQPAAATLRIESLPAMTAELEEGVYHFELPPQTSPIVARLKVGDFVQSLRVEPKLRPELTSASAQVQLPEYLQRPQTVEQDVRSGSLSVVEGSQATVRATASRPLNRATVNEVEVPVEEASFATASLPVAGEASRLKMNWEDFDGLAGRDAFELTVQSLVDELPSVVSQNLPRQAVVLDSEQINFQALAADDFGIKRLGMSWKGLDDRLLADAAEGEKVLSAGAPESSSMQVPATFSANSLEIPAQPIEVRLWVEDYKPDHERVYSQPHLLYVLTAEQHAIWITEQLSKWHRESLDVRDKELQLHATNKRLREMSEEELQDEELRKELRRQSSLEASNGRRLAGLSKNGEDLLRQAARNPEIGVGHLDRWAEMLQVLNDIGANRMPSVSDLLQKAAAETKLARPSNKKTAPVAGQVRNASGGSGPPSEEKENQPEQPMIPKVVDSESSMQPQENQEQEESGPPKKKFNGSRQGLAGTTLAGPAKSSPNDPEEEEQEEEETMDQAIHEQADLLAEFEKIADELNTVLANLEGSTLVKRLKAASREQNQVAEKISSRIDTIFGRGKQLPAEDKEILKELTVVEEKSSQAISYIMDDMQSYFERRRMNQFKVVLEDMKESEVLVALRTLGEEIPVEHGMSIAQAEYWSDTMDRWAEDLVDPAGSGQCPGCKTSDSLPPSLILEVLRILESEVNLREETRVAEQARSAVENSVHRHTAFGLRDTQEALKKRTDAVVVDILELPEGTQRFGKEIDLLTSVSRVMADAQSILGSEETGSTAIAAETEAIELLLQCKRINPKGGGGGGTSPGGGGKGTTQDSALALLGSGLNQNERREARDVTQATGDTGRVLPAEYRGGLDEYFHRLEQGK